MDEQTQKQQSGDAKPAQGEQQNERRMTRAEWEHEAQDEQEQKEQRRRAKEREHRKSSGAQHNWKKIALWAALGLGVAVVIFLIGYIPHRRQQKKLAAEARQREQEQPQVEVMQVRRSPNPGELTIPGTTASMTEAFLYARANGYLAKRYVDIGDHVHKGQLMAIIDAPDLDQQVEQAREQLHQAEAQEQQQEAQLNLNRVTWDRWRVLVAKGVFSRQDGDQREADYQSQVAIVNSAKRNIESYRANLSRMIALQSFERITAPFDGVVTQRNADVGALVGASGSASAAPQNAPSTQSGGSASAANANTSGSSGTVNQSATPMTGQAQGGPIFAVAADKQLRILVSAPEGYAESIHSGMQAKVYVQERPNHPIVGKVTRVANAIDPNTRTMLVEVDIDNADGSLYPGMYAVVSFVQVRGEGSITIPGDAVVVRQDKTAVAVVRNQQVAIVPVEIGRDFGPSVEVLNGLHEGDWLVTTVTDSVEPGIKVRTRISKETPQGLNSETSSQSAAAPDSGPNQYGDESITNSKSENSTQGGKAGQSKGGDKGSGPEKSQGKQQNKKGGTQ